jgi:hypothetical protein
VGEAAGEGNSPSPAFLLPCSTSRKKAGWHLDDVRPITGEAEYERAIKEIAAFFEHEPEPGTREGDRFDALAAAIEAYEDAHYPISGASAKRSPKVGVSEQ